MDLSVVQFLAAERPGEAELVAFHQACAMREAGMTCITVASLPDRLAARYHEAGLEIVPDRHLARWYGLMRAGSYRSLVERRKPVAAIVHGPRLARIARVATGGIPVICFPHGSDPRACLGTNALICGTARQAERADEICRAEGRAARIFTIPAALAAGGGDDGVAPPREGSRPLVIGTFGRHVKHNALDHLLFALRILHDRAVPFRCLIGGDGPEREALEKLARSLRLDGSVEFRGWVEDRTGFLDAIDLFCQTSLRDSAGLAVAEAMSRARPVIATGTDGAMEMIRPNRDGVVVPMNDPVALAATLCAFAARRELLAEMGTAGRDRIMARLSAGHVGAMLRGTILELGAARSAPPCSTATGSVTPCA